MPDIKLIKKLEIKSPHRVTILNAPEGVIKNLLPMPFGVVYESVPTGKCDVVLVFMKDSAELSRVLPRALAAAKDDCIFWCAYPKQTSKVTTDIDRDHGWEMLTGRGLRPVAQISIDDTWSALRFRPKEVVGGRNRRIESVPGPHRYPR